MTDLTWKCHVCKDERPDDKISVYSITRTFPNGIKVKTNVRYCNDRPECERGAPNVDFYN